MGLANGRFAIAFTRISRSGNSISTQIIGCGVPVKIIVHSIRGRVFKANGINMIIRNEFLVDNFQRHHAGADGS